MHAHRLKRLLETYEMAQVKVHNGLDFYTITEVTLRDKEVILVVEKEEKT